LKAWVLRGLAVAFAAVMGVVRAPWRRPLVMGPCPALAGFFLCSLSGRGALDPEMVTFGARFFLWTRKQLPSVITWSHLFAEARENRILTPRHRNCT